MNKILIIRNEETKNIVFALKFKYLLLPNINLIYMYDHAATF